MTKLCHICCSGEKYEATQYSLCDQFHTHRVIAAGQYETRLLGILNNFIKMKNTYRNSTWSVLFR